MKLLRLNKENAKKFYGIHKEKPFFESLCEYMTSGPIIVMTLEKENAHKKDSIISRFAELIYNGFWFSKEREGLQKIIVNLQTEDRIGIIICDHQARDLLSCVDVAMILSNCKIIEQGTPKELINNPIAQNAYFGEAFKIN